MRNIKDFQARYDRWKNGERYWDIRGIDLPRYDTGDKNTVITDDGSVFNVDPSAIGARNLEVTTPDVEVIGKKQYPYQSAFNPYALTEGIQYALGNTVGKVMEPISKIPGAMPVLRTLTPSNWIGTLRTGMAPWNKNNPGFGDSYGDKQLNLLFDLGASKVPISGAGRVLSKVPHTGEQFFNSLPYKAIYNARDVVNKTTNFMRANPFNMRPYYISSMIQEARRNPQFMLKNIQPLHEYKIYTKGATDLMKQRYQYAYRNNRNLFRQYDKQYGGIVIGETPVEANLNNIKTIDYIPYKRIAKMNNSRNPFVNIPDYFNLNMGPAFALGNLIKINRKALRDLGFDEDITYSHELNHALTPKFVWVEKPNGMSFSHLNKSVRDYFKEHNFTELKARGTQLKNYFGITDNQPITGDMLRYAAKNYVKDTGVDNNMTQFFSGIKDWDTAAEWLSKNAM